MRDTILNELAMRAGGLRFDDSAKSQFEELKSLHLSFKNCHKSIFYRWEVRMYLAGAQRPLGSFNLLNDYHAVQFADLCIVRFAKYRKTTRALTDSDLNYSVALAERTLREHSKAAQLLDKIEDRLQQNYQLAPRRDGDVSRVSFMRALRRFERLNAPLIAQTPGLAASLNNVSKLIVDAPATPG